MNHVAPGWMNGNELPEGDMSSYLASNFLRFYSGKPLGQSDFSHPERIFSYLCESRNGETVCSF